MDISMPYVSKKQTSLGAIVERYGISKAAEKLGYTRSYISNVFKGKMKVTDNLKKRIAKLNTDPRHLVATDMLTESDKLRAQKLTMQQRRDALLGYKGE